MKIEMLDICIQELEQEIKALKEHRAKLARHIAKSAPIKSYYSLIAFEGGRWNVQFGDYQRQVVKQEIYDSYPDHFTKIIKHDDTPEAIELELKKLNGQG